MMLGDEFIHVARMLSGLNKDTPDIEAFYRSAVSRAYYAVLNYANHILRLADCDRVVKARDHGLVHQCFSNSSDGDTAKAGTKMGSLHSERIDADYEMNQGKFSRQSNVAFQIKKALDVLKELSKYEREPDVSNLKADINIYLRRTGR